MIKLFAKPKMYLQQQQGTRVNTDVAFLMWKQIMLDKAQ